MNANNFLLFIVLSYYEDDFFDLGIADCSFWLDFVLSFEYLLQQLIDSIFYIHYLSSLLLKILTVEDSLMYDGIKFHFPGTRTL